jgi:hypothetical protein
MKLAYILHKIDHVIVRYKNSLSLSLLSISSAWSCLSALLRLTQMLLLSSPFYYYWTISILSVQVRIVLLTQQLLFLQLLELQCPPCPGSPVDPAAALPTTTEPSASSQSR